LSCEGAFTRADLYLFKAHWNALVRGWARPYAVVHPPVFPERYRVETTREKILFVNMSALKGVETFFRIVERMPHRRFLAVIGGYSKQAPPPRAYDNLEVVGPLEDIRHAYSRAKIVLMPSVLEAFGRVALEAAASGIPTIAANCPGLREALGSAGRFVAHDDIDAWVQAITELENDEAYAAAVNKVLHRSNAMDPSKELREFEGLLRNLTQQSGTHMLRNDRDDLSPSMGQ
jgi:glycosyltransferase involved in cell wall biosynthesis